MEVIEEERWLNRTWILEGQYDPAGELSLFSLEEDISKKVEGNHHIVWQSILPWGGNVRAWMQGGGRLCRE